MKIEPRTLKGFRDFLPKTAKKRQFVLNTLIKVFESYGFEPLETPSIEYDEVLSGKYGDEGEKLMYKFEDNGKRKVALRYDQTVPLARVIAQYQNEIKFPFKRYQIQNVWRAENTQKGRYREFLQVDGDIVSSSSPLSDAEIISCAATCLKKLGFTKFKILINTRSSFLELGVSDEKLKDVIKAVDKLKRVGKENVVNELTRQGFSKEETDKLLSEIENKKTPREIEEILQLVGKENVEFFPALARGLDYYTGMIFEIEVEGCETGSIAGGGRYDNLIGLFTNKDICAVGFSFGFDRLIEAMDKLNLFPKDLQTTKVLITVPSLEKIKQSLEIANELRSSKINTEIYLGNNLDLEKQLKYADNREIPYVIITGDKLILKDMQKRTQEEKSLEEIKKFLS